MNTIHNNTVTEFETNILFQCNFNVSIVMCNGSVYAAIHEDTVDGKIYHTFEKLDSTYAGMKYIQNLETQIMRK